MSIRVLANHAHVFPASLNPEGTIERLLSMLDACAIEQAVCFAPLPYQCDGKSLADPNAWLAGELRGSGCTVLARLIRDETMSQRR